MYEDETKKKFAKLIGKTDTVILGIESSCDETAAAIVKGGKTVLSDIIASQILIHRRFGGVVPEIASRNHTLAINSVIDEALKSANLTFNDLDAVAVTYGAGLAGALLIGVSAAKAISYSLKKPLIKVNHIEAHIAANYIENQDLIPPFISVVASGGHTNIVEVNGLNDYLIVGGTKDDAIGEAFDKVARILHLPYPGGPEIDKLSKLGKPNIEFYKLPKHAKNDLSLSYSGLKTAVVNYVHKMTQNGDEIPLADVCASFTKTAVDLLVETAILAAQNASQNLIVLAGGVAANSYLREKLTLEASKRGIKTLIPSPRLCTDNAVMVAMRAYHSIFEGENLADLSLNIDSSLRVKSNG